MGRQQITNVSRDGCEPQKGQRRDAVKKSCSGHAAHRVGQTVCSPASPSCLDPGLPTHTTLHRTELEGSSSKMTSTSCPRLRRELTRSLKPPGELSTMRQGDLSECPEEWTIRLARFFVTIRIDARCSGDKLHLGEVVSQHTKQDL